MVAFFSVAITLFLVIDALGSIPVYLHLLKKFDKGERRRIALRELFIALGLMIVFNFVGKGLLTLLGIEAATVQLAGGIVLFLIAIRLIFSHEEEEIEHRWHAAKPFIVPIATPIIAGPSVLAVVMILAQQEDDNWPTVLGAIFAAWFLSSLIFLFAKPIFAVIKDKGLNACKRLMGLIVGLIAVQHFLEGIVGAFTK